MDELRAPGEAQASARSALLVRPLAAHAREHLSGFILVAGVLGVLLASVGRAARAR